MRFLKRKILGAAGKTSPFQKEVVKKSPNQVDKRKTKTSQAKIRKTTKKSGLRVRPLKNLVKNYGRAICSFITDKISNEYINPVVKKEGVTTKNFKEYIYEKKDFLDGIDTFRSMLLIEDSDSDLVKKFKRIFQKICEVFVKYFSVNWIFDSKLAHKDVYLKYRFRMLRRIQQPEYFTYLK